MILADGPAGLRLTAHFGMTPEGKTVSYTNPLTGKEVEDLKVPEGTREYYQYCTAIPVAALLGLMEQDFALARAVLVAQEKKIWRMAHQLKNTMGSIYMERKLAAKLWKLARDFGVPVQEGIEIDIYLPITLLADMLGAPRETTSRICGMLAEAGLITIRKKRIIVTAPDRMAHFYKTGDMS